MPESPSDLLGLRLTGNQLPVPPGRGSTPLQLRWFSTIKLIFVPIPTLEQADGPTGKRANRLMHEMGIAAEIVRIAVESIPEEMTGSKVVRVHLKVGKLAAVVAESLRFCFEIVAKETAAEGAQLDIKEMAVVAQCNMCDHQWEIENAVFSCPRCGSGSIDMLSGRELDIDSIELEQG